MYCPCVNLLFSLIFFVALSSYFHYFHVFRLGDCDLIHNRAFLRAKIYDFILFLICARERSRLFMLLCFRYHGTHTLLRFLLFIGFVSSKF